MKHRVVSLLPAATEMVCALGCADRLVGRSHECDFPESVRRLPACTEPRLDSAQPGAAIHQQVRGLLEASLAVCRVDAERLKALKPDLIVTQAQCAVCAVSEAEVEQALARWVGGRPQIISLAPLRLVDIWNDLRRVAEALSIEDAGRSVVKPLKTRCVDIIEKTAGMTRRPTVGCLEWLDPLMAAGNWVPELVDLAGGRDVLGEAGKHSARLDWARLIEANPDVLLLMPCGFDLTRALRELPALAARPEWKQLRAVKNHRVYVTDGSAYFNRPGPRIVDSLEILAEVIHPTLFDPAHQGGGWEQI